jgi:tRNA A37 threonylcarbamoyladenosine biosynthesis protein TsaE
MNKSKIGLNRKDAEKALKSFFGTNDARVLAVKGDWGVGKTYLVKKTFADLKIECFYSSAFGATSISDIKAPIQI